MVSKVISTLVTLLITLVTKSHEPLSTLNPKVVLRLKLINTEKRSAEGLVLQKHRCRREHDRRNPSFEPGVLLEFAVLVFAVLGLLLGLHGLGFCCNGFCCSGSGFRARGGRPAIQNVGFEVEAHWCSFDCWWKVKVTC